MDRYEEIGSKSIETYDDEFMQYECSECGSIYTDEHEDCCDECGHGNDLLAETCAEGLECGLCTHTFDTWGKVVRVCDPLTKEDMVEYNKLDKGRRPLELQNQEELFCVNCFDALVRIVSVLEGEWDDEDEE